jgi:hypothetical protein
MVATLASGRITAVPGTTVGSGNGVNLWLAGSKPPADCRRGRGYALRRRTQHVGHAPSLGALAVSTRQVATAETAVVGRNQRAAGLVNCVVVGCGVRLR